MATTTNISKSKYCSGVQCPKMLWLKIHKPELFDNSVMREAILEAGTKVGELARGLFGDFKVVKFGDSSKMAQETKDLISAGEKVIAEASFLYAGLFCSIDILKNLGEGRVELYEVKSSTSVNDIYLHDVSFQVYVLEKCGYTVEKACLVHINNQYIRGQELELEKLFAIKDLTEVVHQMQPEVHDRVLSLKECISNSEEPDTDLGVYCSAPYDCGYWQYCSEKLPSPNVFDIAGMATKKKVEYYKQGIIIFILFKQMIIIENVSIETFNLVLCYCNSSSPESFIGLFFKIFFKFFFQIYQNNMCAVHLKFPFLYQ